MVNGSFPSLFLSLWIVRHRLPTTPLVLRYS